MNPFTNKATEQNGNKKDKKYLENVQLLETITEIESEQVPVARKTKIEPENNYNSKDKAPFKIKFGRFLAPVRERWSQQSLGVKAIIVAICLGVLPVAIVGGIASDLARKSMRETIISDQEGRTVDLANEVSLFVQGILDNTQAIASSPMLVDPSLNQTASIEQKIALLDSVIDASQITYRNIAVFDSSGNLLFQSTPKENKQIRNIRKFQPIIERVRQNNRSTIDTLRENKTNNLISAAAIKEKPTGTIIGYIVTRMDMDSLESIFANIVAQDWEYKIIGEDKKIFIADETEYIGKLAREDLRNFDRLYEEVNNNNQKKTKYSSPVGTRLLLDIGEANNQQEKVLVSYTRVSQVANIIQNDWGLIVSRPEQQAFAPVRELRNFLFGGVIIATLVVGGVAIVFARRAIEPIVLAAGAVEKIGRGQLDTRLMVSGSDERSVLCDNINNMAGELKVLIEEQAISISQSRFLVQITSTPVFDRIQLQNLFAKAIVGVRKILQIERALIYRFDKDGNAIVAYESVIAPYQSVLSQEISKVCLPPELIFPKYKKGKVIANQDINRADFHQEYIKLMEDWQVKSNLIVPIFLQQGQLYGLLIAHHCQEYHPWQTREINFLKQVAAQLGVTLDRIGLLEAREQEANRSELLKNITLKLASSIEPEAIYQTAVNELQESLDSDRAIIVDWQRSPIGRVIAEKFNPSFKAIPNKNLSIPDTQDDLALELYEQGEVREIANVATTTNLTLEDRQELEKLSVKAYLVAPILVAGELESFCIIHQCDRPRDWEKSDIDLVYQVATQVGVALERSNLLEQQKVAKELLQNRAIELLEEVDPVSSGNLTVSARVTEDEIGTIADFYNSTVESLRKLVTQVKASSEQVAHVTKINQTAVQDLSWGAKQQSTDIEAAMKRIGHMSNATNEVARNAEKASVAVQKASVTVVEGETAMNRMVEGIEGIRQTVAKTSKKIKRLGESSQKISKVVNLIGTFAEQTNLLALNASIEAAHAGEQGKGFAVVAEEVRALSQQSAQATAEIEKILTSIQTETKEVISAMEEGTARVVAGTVLADETRSALEKIALASVQINQLVLSIAEATAIQSQEEEAVSNTIAEVAEISQQTSADATSVSASFEELLAVAQKLQESVDRFKVE
ncbi:MAG: methyl-accepting chemotaxis protein [Prochloraceae cyanobacterium]